VVADETFLGIIHDLNLLHSLGVHIVVIHGSRPQIEAILAQQGIESRYAFGLRVTDAETMDCVLEASGQVRSRIEALLSLGIANSPMAGARIRVSSGNFITAKPQGVIDGIDMELTGEVRRVDTDAIHQRLEDGDIVLISPLGYSPTGEIYNLALEAAARSQANLMAGKDQLAHNLGLTLRERVSAAGYDGAVGENIAGGQQSLQQAIEGWLNSPGHRATLLSDKFTEFGLAVAYVPSGRKSRFGIYWCFIAGGPFSAWATG